MTGPLHETPLKLLQMRFARSHRLRARRAVKIGAIVNCNVSGYRYYQSGKFAHVNGLVNSPDELKSATITPVSIAVVATLMSARGLHECLMSGAQVF
jgi:hypothetical protein